MSFEHLCLVAKIEIEKNTIYSLGKIAASSESMTHGAIYSANPTVNCVLHIHSRKIFDIMAAAEGCNFTEENIPYGTPQMANAVMDEVEKIGAPNGIIVMLGHDEGVISFGENISSALAEILRFALR
jgi:ribulose-5-phosphate 4-epimerase/fuculose-1-phosphate aldolase